MFNWKYPLSCSIPVSASANKLRGFISHLYCAVVLKGHSIHRKTQPLRSASSLPLLYMTPLLLNCFPCSCALKKPWSFTSQCSARHKKVLPTHQVQAPFLNVLPSSPLLPFLHLCAFSFGSFSFIFKPGGGTFFSKALCKASFLMKKSPNQPACCISSQRGMNSSLFSFISTETKETYFPLCLYHVDSDTRE